MLYKNYEKKEIKMNALEIDNFFNGVNRMSNLQIKFDKLIVTECAE